MPPRHALYGLMAVVAMGVGLRVSYQGNYLTSSPYVHDTIEEAKTYHDLAVQVANGYALDHDALPPSALYPLALGGVYRSAGAKQLRWVVLLQGLLGLATLLLTYLLGARLVSAEVGVIAAGLYVLYGPLMFFETKRLPVALTVFVNVLVLVVAHWALSRKRAPWAVLAGLGLGLLVAVGPSLTLFPLLLGGFAVVQIVRSPVSARRPLLARGGWVVLGFACALTPQLACPAGGDVWPLRNGLDFYTGNNPQATGRAHVPPGFLGPREQRWEEARRLAAQSLHVRDLSDREVSAYYYRQGLGWMASHPAGWLGHTARKSYRFAMADEAQDNFSYGFERDQWRGLRLAAVPFSLLFVFGVAGLFFLPALRRRRWLWCNVLAHGLVGIVFFVSSAWRVSVAPVLAVGAAAALCALAVRIGRDWRRPVGLLAAGLVLTGILLWNPLDNPREARSREWTRQGLLMERQGRPMGAQQAYRRALKEIPGNYIARVHLGNTEAYLRHFKQAIVHYERAIKLAPHRPLAHINLARVTQQMAERALVRSAGRGAGADWLHSALSHVQLALQSDPNQVDALLTYAQLQRSMGRIDQAEALLERALSQTQARGDVHAERGIVATIKGDFPRARSHFWAATLLGHRPDPHWMKLLEEPKMPK